MFYFILGYVLAVIFPIYGLNAYIVELWTKLGSYVRASAAASPVAPSPGVTSPVVKPPSSQHVNKPRL